VREDSPAAKKGLRVGDVIAMVGQTDVSTPRDVVREVEQALEANADVVLLLVARGDNEHFVALNLA
jgi:serine protease Do